MALVGSRACMAKIQGLSITFPSMRRFPLIQMKMTKDNRRHQSIDRVSRFFTCLHPYTTSTTRDSAINRLGGATCSASKTTQIPVVGKEKQTIQVTPPLYDYILSHTNEHDVLAELREETLSVRGSGMQVSPDQGRLLGLLVQLMGAERCIEVGVFTGYSSVSIALALPEHGRLVACDRSKDTLEIAQKYYAKAGVAHKVDVREGLALDTLAAMVGTEGEVGSYDFAFLDADKRKYPQYYEMLLQLLRPKGLLVIDNVLWSGRIIDTTDEDPQTQTLRALNDFVFQDARVSSSMLAIGDGLTLCYKL